MPAKFFENFPVVSYGGVSLRNLMLKTDIIKSVLDTVQVFHPFVIRDGERADTVAYDYYGNSELYWLVYMANDIVDPYYDWPLTQAEFKDFIVKKYGSAEAAQGTLLYWSNPDFDYYMTDETRNLLDVEFLSGWNTPVYAYDYEDGLNEAKRNIRLIDSSYAPQVVAEIGRIYG
jgi:hypothetical protein